MENQEDLRYWLALNRAPDIGPIRFLRLINAFKDLREVFKASRRELANYGISEKAFNYLQSPLWKLVDQDLLWLTTDKRRSLITWNDLTYPPLLREIHAPPALLYIQGNPEVLCSRQLAIVGSRNPSVTGINNAHQFTKALIEAGFAITSGLALGIDVGCHQCALAHHGLTIAVMGTGLDIIYPMRHQALAEEICQKGVLISELPLGTGPKAENFPQRNRLISGLALGVLVVEAALQSGSLITARYAVEQGREVFAIPGSIHNPLAKGCHFLLRQGAKLVETVNDILEELGSLTTPMQQACKINEQKESGLPLANDYVELLQCMGFEPVTIDMIIIRSNLTSERVSSMLLELELQGHIIAVPGGYQRGFNL